MAKSNKQQTPLNYWPKGQSGSGFSWLKGRLVLLLVLTTITLLATVIYAGPSSGVVIYRLLADGGILLLWLAAAAGFGALLFRLILRVTPESPLVLRLVTCTALGLGAMSLAILGLGLCGAMNIFSAWVMIATGLTLGAVTLLRNDTPENRANIRIWLGQPGGAHWLWLMAFPMLVAAVVGAMAPPGFLWSQSEPHPYDVLEYHLQVPREWYEAGRIIPLHHNVFSYFPFNVEMHFLLAMHLRGGPWAGMYLAQLMHGAFVLLSIAAVYGFARWKVPRLAAVLATLAMATVPALARLAPIAYDEGGLLLFGTLAIGWAVRAMVEPGNRARRFILAGLFAGFACGSKLTAVPEVLGGIGLITAAMTLWIALRRPQSAREILVGSAVRTISPFSNETINAGPTKPIFPGEVMVRGVEPTRLPAPRQRKEFVAGQLFGIVLFGLAGLLTFSPWLIRNVIWIGNPIYPEGTNLLGKGDFSDVQIERWHRAHSAQPSQQSTVARVTAFGNQVLLDWQFGYAVLPLALIAFGFSVKQPEAWFLGALLLLLLVVWLFFTHLQGRFFILGVPIGSLLIATALAESRSSWTARPVNIFAITLITLQAAVGSIRQHADLAGRLYGPSGFASFLGIEDFSGTAPQTYIDNVPKDVPVVLVGDANAFWWQIPMTRLHYRTVFDADTSKETGIVDAWAGPIQNRAGAWLLISPIELRRFEKTYQPLPPVPDWILRHGSETFAVPPGQLPK